MKIAMQVERPEDVRVTLTTTMTVAQWGVMIGALTEAIQGPQGKWHHDVCALRDAIENAVSSLQERVTGEPRTIRDE